MGPRPLDFFFFIGSTYTYLSVARAEDAAARAGVALRWRPFSVRTIMREQDNSPFAGKPAKLRYMWRDLERRAALHGIPFRAIPAYPVDPDELANRVGALAATEGWCPAYARTVYRRWFLEDQPPGDLGSLRSALEELGKDPAAVIERADSAEIRAAYASSTGDARSLGIFGSPTFACGTEIFWGDDRLEEALAWAAGGP